MALRGLLLEAVAHNVSADTVAGVVWPGVGEGASQLVAVAERLQLHRGIGGGIYAGC